MIRMSKREIREEEVNGWASAKEKALMEGEYPFFVDGQNETNSAFE